MLFLFASVYEREGLSCGEAVFVEYVVVAAAELKKQAQCMYTMLCNAPL